MHVRVNSYKSNKLSKEFILDLYNCLKILYNFMQYLIIMEKRVVELFAGVGGFRVGLNNIKGFNKNGKAKENGSFKFVWANQWEPSTKTQHAFDCYNTRFPGENNSNVDISKVNKKEIPDHDLLVGGFPCQDYSVAHTLSHSKGIEGKKGVLWWEIKEILLKKKPSFTLLENVDRLLKSPAKQRGRDFGIMLRCFADLGYAVEWRVINAGENGHPQRRRRIFIFAYRKTTKYYKEISKLSAQEIINSTSIFAKQYPIKKIAKSSVKHVDLLKKYDDLVSLSNKFKYEFENAGYMSNGLAYTAKVEPLKISFIPLIKIVEKEGVDSKYFLTKEQVKKYAYLRGNKKIKRTKPNGETYYYSEGAMSPFDALNLPGRTMLTSEGTTNRSTHIIMDPEKNKLRLLTPVECERLNQFPDNWTNTGMSDKRRCFMMGNALVCGIISKLGKEISEIIDNEN